LYYKSESQAQMLLQSATFARGNPSKFLAQRSLPSLRSQLKSHRRKTFLAIYRQIRFHKWFWKVLRQINPYVSNKWPLKLPCAYLNTQESRHTGTPLIWNKGG
ncbi:hypothetical protein T12_11690, partial [Trichinella patagoniensis]